VEVLRGTADIEFLRWHAAEILLEIARFFASLAEYDRSRDRFEIRGVMGPDEYHDAYPEPTSRGSTTTPTRTSWRCGCCCAPWRCSSSARATTARSCGSELR
jgi:hypothetical protein